MALAPPPGTIIRSRCFKIRTGASRETREISPNTNSSATRSPSTVTVAWGNASTIFLRRSVSLLCFVMIFDDGGSSSPSRIFSHCRRTRGNLRHQKAQDGLSIEQFHSHGCGNKGFHAPRIFLQIDHIFLCGNESRAILLFANGQQISHIFLGVGMVIGEGNLHGSDHSSFAQLPKKSLWSRDPAKSHHTRWDRWKADSAPHSPNRLSSQPSRRIGNVLLQHNHVGAFQCRQRLAQTAARQQAILKIRGIDHHNIEVACQGAVLKSVIQQMDTHSELRFREQASFVTLLAYDHRHSQSPCDEQWFVAKLRCFSVRIDRVNSRGGSSVSAREHIELHSAGLQKLTQGDDEWRFTRSAYRQIANANHRSLQAPRA